MSNWIPELMYEELDGGMTSKIPFIIVPTDEVMPQVLFVFESRETGDFEPGAEGEDLPVSELDLYQYANMATLKEGLTGPVYDMVRDALGLEPLEQATAKGARITEQVQKNLGLETQPDFEYGSD